MRCLCEELRITKKHYKATLKQHWKFLFIKSHVVIVKGDRIATLSEHTTGKQLKIVGREEW